MNKVSRFAILLSFMMSAYASAEQVIKPTDPRWSLSGSDVSVTEIDGKEAIKIGRGKALLEQVMFENGTLEFDVYLPNERAFAYLYFRGQNEQEFEEIYLRTHKPNAPDALQYAPVFQGRSAWQLYHGDKGTASAHFNANQWIPIKVVLAGSQMQVWVGQDEAPTMTIERLGRDSQAGWIGFRGFIPNTSSAEFSAYFSGVTLTPIDTNTIEVSRERADLPAGQITQWKVSEAFASKPGPISELPDHIIDSEWINPPMQPDGSMEFLRSVQIPEGVRHYSTAAQVIIHSDAAQTCGISLGFSDQLTLSLNDQAIVYQDARYRFDKPRRQGVMHADQLRVYLPLKAGNNRLRAVVSDNFGGWGLMGRLHQCAGIEVR